MMLPNWLEKYAAADKISEGFGVPDSLRGWNLRPGMGYYHYLPTNIALANCPSGRIAYLHIRGEIPYTPTLWTSRGKVIHEIMHQAYLEVFDRPAKTIEEIIKDVAKTDRVDEHALSRAGKYAQIREAFLEFFRKLSEDGVSVTSEAELDGAPLGMSAIRADLIASPPNVILDLKTHKHRGKSLKKHYLQITAYALAWEAETHAPVDIGGILEIVEQDDDIKTRILPFHVSAELRREVVRRISQKAKVCRSISPEDPGLSSEDVCSRCYIKDFCWSTL